MSLDEEYKVFKAIIFWGLLATVILSTALGICVAILMFR
jgi:hypothetical protein